MTRAHPERRATGRRARLVVAALAAAGLLAACLTLGLGNRIADPDAPDHRATALQIAGDDLAPAVLPAALAVLVLVAVAGIVDAPRRLPRTVRLPVHRGRAPPSSDGI